MTEVSWWVWRSPVVWTLSHCPVYWWTVKVKGSWLQGSSGWPFPPCRWDAGCESTRQSLGQPPAVWSHVPRFWSAAPPERKRKPDYRMSSKRSAFHYTAYFNICIMSVRLSRKPDLALRPPAAVSASTLLVLVTLKICMEFHCVQQEYFPLKSEFHYTFLWKLVSAME